ncbi:MAG: hypothetical protein PHH00_02305 [Candidatus Nanoarchaeia archaeon]|nr:hypothetical protein [Candidatus Nanoarchaeia archaeon]
MKRVWAFAVIFLLLVSMISAGIGLTGEAVNLGSNQGDDSGNQGQNHKLGNVTQPENKIKIKDETGGCPAECTCTGSATKCGLDNGTREMTVHAGKSGNIIVQVKGINASTNVTLYKSEEGKLYGVFRNNETKEIKMLPDQVQEKITERLNRLLENETIELGENGEYKYEAKERAKLFALFSVKLRVTAEVNAETGKITGLRKAWWAFLAKEEGNEIVGASCGTVTPGYNDECCVNKGYDVYNQTSAECEFNSG